MRSTWVAIALAMACGLALTDPASAQDGAGAVEWYPLQSERGRAVPDDAVAGMVSIRARIRSQEGQRWNVDALAPPGASYPGFGTLCEGEAGNESEPIDVDCPWDTAVYPGGEASWNHVYLLRLSTGGDDGKREAASERKVIIANRATPPADVRLSFDDSSHQVRLEWKPNREPDLAAYVVEERAGSGRWHVVAEVTGPSYETRVEEPGTYRYRLAALRRVAESRRAPPSRWARPDPSQITIDSPTADAPDPTDGEDSPGSGVSPESSGGETSDPAPAEGAPPDQSAPGEPEAPTPPGDTVAPPAPDAPAPPPGTEEFPVPRLAGVTTTWTTELALPVTPVPGSGGITVVERQSLPATSGVPAGKRGPAARPPAPPPALTADAPPADEGFSLTLPYETRRPTPYPVPGRGSELRAGLPRSQALIANAAATNARAALAPLAGGFALVILALQLAYIARLSGQRRSWDAGAPGTA